MFKFDLTVTQVNVAIYFKNGEFESKKLLMYGRVTKKQAIPLVDSYVLATEYGSNVKHNYVDVIYTPITVEIDSNNIQKSLDDVIYETIKNHPILKEQNITGIITY
jgi:hypothetical protein